MIRVFLVRNNNLFKQTNGRQKNENVSEPFIKSQDGGEIIENIVIKVLTGGATCRWSILMTIKDSQVAANYIGN